jgi:hypothetical protein
VFGTAFSVGLCAAESALRTRRAQTVTMRIFIGSLPILMNLILVDLILMDLEICILEKLNMGNRS